MDDLESIERAVSALEQQRPLLGDDVVDTALRPLLDKRSELRGREFGEQRKLVTVLFTDVVDFTVLAQALDPEDTRDVVNSYFTRWRRHVEEEGGVVEKFIGDAMMAVFGLYQAREDDPHRAIRAALAMTGDLGALNDEFEDRHGIRLSMRTGIDTGEVVVSTLDDRADHQFVVVGDIVNRAARLQSAATRDGILISADTHHHVRGAFGFQPVGGLQLKGITGTVDAYLVLAERPRAFRLDGTRGVEGIETITVGRDIEMRQLQERLGDVSDDHRWQVVTLLGDAGVGKTRLLLDFDRWLGEVPDVVWWFRGRAAQSTQNQPGALLRDALTARFGINDSDLPDQVRAKCRQGLALALGEGAATARKADLVGLWLGFELGDDARAAADQMEPPELRGRAMAALGQYFARLSEQAPVVILLEDLHWADDLSLECLDAADSVLRDSRVLVVATARPNLLERRPLWGEGLAHHSRLHLEPLSRRESRALLAQLLARVDVVPAALTELLVDAAEGNPFYIEELVRYLVDSGVILREQSEWRIGDEHAAQIRVPSTLKGVLQARIDALSAAERGLVQRASVIGRVFWDTAVEHLTSGHETTESLDHLDRLRHREVIYERELPAFDDTREFLFKHALLRDVAYDGILRARRQRYHELAAGWLEQVSERSNRVDEYAAVIADHLDQARAPAASAWYLRAGRQAASVHALSEATRLLGRGLELVAPDDHDLRFDLLAARQDVMNWMGDRDAERADLASMEAVVGQVEDPDRQVSMLLAQARANFVRSLYDDTVTSASAAAALAASAGLAARQAEAELMWGKGLTWRFHHDEAETVLHDALATARAAGQDKIVGETLRYLSMVANNRGDFTRALEWLDEAHRVVVASRDSEGQSTVLAQFSTVYYNVGRLDEARAYLEQTLPIFRESGNPYREAIALGNLASIAVRNGELALARRRATESSTIMERLTDMEGTITARLVLADLCLTAGDWTGAEDHATDARTMAAQIDAAPLIADSLLLLTVAALETADLERAETLAAASEEVAAATGSALAVAVAALAHGYVLSAAGHLDRADDVLARASDGFAPLGVPPQQREAQAARAQVAWRGGNASAAVELVRPLVEHLSVDGLVGTLRPMAVLRTCREVLAAAADPQAGEVAAAADAYVAERAARIGDGDLRRRYLDLAATVSPRQVR